MENTLKFIGKINSSLKKIEDCPLQESEHAPAAEIDILPEFGEAIKDITVGTEIILLTWFHKADRSILSCYPRNDKNAHHIGVFSTRSPDRPNPIGIHIVKVEGVSKSKIKVSALEALDQTPVVDIKPVWRERRNQ